MTAAVALVGGHGYGAHHLDRLLSPQAAGVVRLVGIADPHPVDDPRIPADVVQTSSLDELLERTTPDIVIIATPIPTHATLAQRALEAGADVVLEKPPTASLAEFRELVAAAAARGRLVQVGFQSLGSAALPALRERIAEGAIGRVTGYSAAATWSRSEEYFRRSGWAGRRRDDRGGVVADGALTNPLAHAVATLLAVAGSGADHAVTDVAVELYRANDIESDDTSFARISLANATEGIVAVTLCASEQTLPVVTAIGDRGRIDFYYSIDVLVEHRSEAVLPRVTRHERVDLVHDLARVRAYGGRLASPLEDAAGFMRVLDAVMDAADPTPIDPAFVDRIEANGLSFRVVRDIETWIGRAVTERAGFRELDAPWAC